ncbi:S-adenosylmethionine decarboxylase [Candidatus Kaiserbacteria bacterium]|nr:MAG: S-adenosylmethionine decarboxylase [Candidatus Kaiserbacteria bacterium]
MKATIWNFRFYIDETDPKKVFEFGKSALEKAEFMMIGFSEHHFYPYGYTALWLIAESHFAIHTFPEQKTTYCELSSCNSAKHAIFVEDMKKYGVKEVE